MRPLSILFLLALIAYSLARFLPVKIDEKVTMKLSEKPVKAFTRKLTKGGPTQTYSINGKNKETWIDEAGTTYPSGNFVYKAPGTMVIKKMTKAAVGTYNFVPKNSGPTTTLPPRVHVDPNPGEGITLVLL